MLTRTLSLRRETLAALTEPELSDVGAGTAIGSLRLCISVASCVCPVFTPLVCISHTCV